MNLTETIKTDAMKAMKEQDSARTAVLRLLISGFKNEEIKLGHELSEEETVKVLQKEAKQRRDSIEAYSKANRPELAEAEQAELEIITSYLPQQMSEEEIGKIVDQVIAETGATDTSQMGTVIGAAMKQIAGKADGASVSKVVRQKLGE